MPISVKVHLLRNLALWVITQIKNSKLLKQKIQQLLSNEKELIDDDNDLFTEKRHVSKSRDVIQYG